MLSNPAKAFKWECAREGGNHAALRTIHGEFNRLFGEDLLTAAGSQCYYAICNDYTFGFCNRSSQERQEIADQRNAAKDTDPFSGSSCGITFGGAPDPYLSYIFSHMKDIEICEGSCGLIKNDVRRC